MSIGASIEALAETAGIAVRDGLQVGALSALAPDPTYPALLLIDAIIVPSHLRRYPFDTEVQLIVEENGSLCTEALEIQALLAAASLPPHALALVLPRVPPEAVRHDLAGLRGVIARLRDPARGCPWDLEQDHRTLRPHLLEETYEVLQALDRDDRHALCEELGDLMMQVFLHAQIAEEDGQFDIDDVAEGIRAKLIRRHPHVFGGVKAVDTSAVVENWDRLKAAERATGNAETSALDGVPQALPALARAQSLAGRAARQGFEPTNGSPFGVATGTPKDANSWGDLLFMFARLAQREGIHLEDALREAADRFEARFRAFETALRTEGVAISELTTAELMERWARTAHAQP